MSLPPQMRTAEFHACAWHDRCTVSFQSQNNWWVRYDAPDGRSFWLDPNDFRWVPFGEQMKIRNFTSRDSALAGLYLAIEPSTQQTTPTAPTKEP